MLKFGVISSIDVSTGLARVYFEEDELVSAPLKISVMRSGPDQITFPFDINEHVWCIMDEHCEYGVIGGAIFDEGNNPSGAAKGKLLIKFADNSAMEYDRNSHILSLNIQGKVNINCTESNLICTSKATITAPQVNVTGILNVTGAANIQGVAAVGGLASFTPGTPVNGSTADLNVKTLTATGDVTTSGDVKAGTVSLKTHRHTSGGSGSPTSTPI